MDTGRDDPDDPQCREYRAEKHESFTNARPAGLCFSGPWCVFRPWDGRCVKAQVVASDARGKAK